MIAQTHTKRIFYILFLLCLFQLAIVHAYIPINSWFANEAFFTDDYSFHYAHVLEKIHFLKEFGSTWAYDPYIRAGTILNFLAPIDNNGCILFCTLLFFIPPAIAFKLYFILAIVIAPLLCYKTSRNLEFPREISILASLMGSLLMHVSVMANFIHWGTLAFVFCSYMSFLTVSFFYRLCRYGRFKDLISTTLLIILSVWIHAFASVILLAPLLLCYFIFARKLSKRNHLGILLGLILIFVVNIPFIYPFYLFSDHLVKDASNLFYLARSPLEFLKTYLLRDNIFNSYLNRIFYKEEWVDILLLLSGLFGIYILSKKQEKQKAFLFLGTFGFLFFLGYFGSFFEITRITPMRFLIPLNLLLVFPSAFGLYHLYRLFLEDKSSKVKWTSLAVISYLLLTLTGPAYFQFFYMKNFRLVSGVPKPFKQLVSWINTNTTSKGRILIEQSDFESQHKYYGTHLTFILPLWTDREYIGNSTFYSATRDAFTSYNAGYLFRKPIQDYSSEDLFAYLKLYNIKWVIYWSEASKQVFEAEPERYSFLKLIDSFYICRVKNPSSFFIKGNGIAKAKYNEIILEQVEPVDNEIIISYHWMNVLKSDPPLKLEKAYVLDDPVEFIKIKNPPSKIKIYNSYRKQN